MAAVTIYSDFGAPQNKVCHYFHFSLSICHEVVGLDAWGWCPGMTQRDGMGRKEGGGGSGWGTCIYLWWINVDVWQNQYNIVK